MERVYKTFSILFDPVLLHFQIYVISNLVKQFSDSRVCAQSCLTLCDPMVCSPPGSSVPGVLRQEYWSGLPFPSPGYIPDPGSQSALWF